MTPARAAFLALLGRDLGTGYDDRLSLVVANERRPHPRGVDPPPRAGLGVVHPGSGSGATSAMRALSS